MSRSFPLIRDSLVLALVGILGSAYIVIDKAFLSQLGPVYLGAESLISYVALFLSTLGRAFGQTVLLTTSAQVDESRRLGGALLAALYSSFALGVALCVAICAVLLRGADPGMSRAVLLTYAILLSLAAIANAVSVATKYALIVQNKLPTLVKGEFLGNGMNALGNAMSLTLLKDPSAQFLGIGISTLLAQLFLVSFYLINRKVRAPEGGLVRGAWNYLRQAWSVMEGEMIYVTVSLVIPLGLSVLLQRQGDIAGLCVYNLGLSWARLPSVVLFAVMVIATRNGVQHQKGDSLKGARVIIAAVVFAVVLFSPLFALQARSAVAGPWNAGLTALASALWSITLALAVSLPGYVRLRASLQTKALGQITLLTQGVLALAALVMVYSGCGDLQWAVAVSVLVGAWAQAALICRRSTS